MTKKKLSASELKMKKLTALLKYKIDSIGGAGTASVQTGESIIDELE